MAFLIDDGYTLHGTIAAKGSIQEVKIEYRPAMAEAVHDYRFKIGQATTGKAMCDIETKAILAQIISWNATNSSGAVIPLTAEILAKVPDGVRREMLRLVMWGIEEAAETEKN